MSEKRNVALVAGGNSSESVISVQSAAQMLKNIDSSKYNAWLVTVSGLQWKVQCLDGKMVEIDKNDFSFSVDDKKQFFDVVLMAIHGNPGEDGFLQAYFKMLNIPVTTCDMFVSALTFNKFACKTFLKEFDIKTAKAKIYRQSDEIDFKQLVFELGLPVFVKPNNGGSSFGASKVKRVEDFEVAFKKAFEHDHEIIAEEFIQATEVTCGVSILNGVEYLLPPTEIVSKNEFFDYEAKYSEGKSEEITPARLSPAQIAEVQQLSLKIYKLLNCKGVVRIDYLLRDGIFYFMEVNSVPGMSASSIVPKQLATYGISFSDFLGLLIEDAIQRK